MRKILAFIFTYRGAIVPLALAPAVVLPWESQSRIHFFSGLALLILGIYIRIVGVRLIGGRARVHSAGARKLITAGIYGRVRNPLYVGNILYAAGLVTLLTTLWAGLLHGTLLLGLYTLIAVFEERSLESQMGEPYRRYLSNVPRWIFKLRPFRDSETDHPTTPFREVLYRERIFILIGLILGLYASSTYWGLLSIPSLSEYISYPKRALGGSAAILVVSLILFKRIASRLKRKRGSWLELDRLSEAKNDGQQSPEKNIS